MVLIFRGYHLCITNLIFVILIHFLQAQTHFKSITFTPTNTRLNGSYILNHVEEVNVVNNKRQWRVRSYSQSAWHFIIILDDSWGFDVSRRSKLTFYIDSPTVARPHTFDDLLFGFTMDNKEYVSMWIPMHANGDLNQIYPGCDTQTIPTQAFGVGDIASLPDYNRNCDIAGSSCNNWIPMLPHNDQRRNKFPIRIAFENNPMTDTASVSFSTANGWTQACGFAPLETQKGLKMYFSGNDRGEQFLLNSFRVEQDVFAPTVRPTVSPSDVPTQAPTVPPTVSPSGVPTQTPTVRPTQTQAPTKTISMNPTYIPTLSPTLVPTHLPTKTPSAMPSLTCGDTVTGMLYHADATWVRYDLNIPGNLATLTLDACYRQTTFETILTLLDSTMTQIALDSNGCNDGMGRSKLVVNNLQAGLYSVLLEAEYPDVEGLYKVSISCSIGSEMVDFCNAHLGL